MATGEYVGLHDGFFQVTIGEASDLIAQFGAGQHIGRIEVRSFTEGRIAQTPPATFLLQE